jgi:hypothetical protein
MQVLDGGRIPNSGTGRELRRARSNRPKIFEGAAAIPASLSRSSKPFNSSSRIWPHRSIPPPGNVTLCRFERPSQADYARVSNGQAVCFGIAVKVVRGGDSGHGGYGYIKDYPAREVLARLKTPLSAGTSEVQRLVIARSYRFNEPLRSITGARRAGRRAASASRQGCKRVAGASERSPGVV